LEKSNKAEREEEKKKEEKGGEKRRRKKEFSGHFVCNAAHLQCRTGSARTSLGPIPDPTDQVQLPGLHPVFPNIPS
jgi:hypothetical protein